MLEEHPGTDPNLIAQFLDAKRGQGCAKATIRTYRGALRRYANWSADARGIGLLDATLDDLENYGRWRRGQGKTRNTVAAEGAALRSFYTWAHDEGLVEATLHLRLAPVQQHSGPQVELHPDALGVLVAEGTDLQAPLHVRDHAIVQLLADTGMTRAEVEQLDWGDVEFDTAYVVVRHAESTRHRTVPLARDTVEALRRLAAESDGTGPVFRNARNGRLSGRSIGDIVAAAGARAGFSDVTPTAIRLAVGRAMYLAGRSPEEIASRLGYANGLTARRAVGAMRAELDACDLCPEDAPEPGCEHCYGTGQTVVAPQLWVRDLDQRVAVMRLRANSGELSNLPYELQHCGWACSEDVRALRRAGRLAGVVAEQLADSPASQAVRAEPLAHDMATARQRLREIATELRKLAAALAARGWVPEEQAKELARAGARVGLVRL